MELIKSILQNYWKEIICVFILLLSVILQAFKKKPINSTLLDIFYAVHDYVIKVEVPGNGPSKKQEVMSLVIEYLKKLYPKLDIDVGILNMISRVIEMYLETPQKGGENDEAQKNG